MQTRPEVALATAYSLVWPYLDERQRRRLLLLPAGVRGLGRGGITAIVRATGAWRQTVHTALPSWTIQPPAVGCPPGAFGALAVDASG
jgi:hypothetical protein